MKKILIGIGAILVLGISYIAYEFATDKPPQFFPLNNPDGDYMVTKGCPNGQGWNRLSAGGVDNYCIEYQGTGVFGYKNDVEAFYRITVGKSQVGLEQYVGRKVKNISGEFSPTSQQCIQTKCTEIGGPFVALDINTLESAE